MSFTEPGAPYFRDHRVTRDHPFPGAHLTTAGNWRMFPCTLDSPHEPWCLHFEWGACNCAPAPEEAFVD